MWPLLLFSILSVACIIERFIFWNNINNCEIISNDFQLIQFTDLSYLKSLKKKDIQNNPYKNYYSK